MKNKKSILIFFLFVIVLVAIIAFFENKKGQEVKVEPEVILPKVEVKKASKGSFVMNYDATGKITNSTYKIGADVIRGKVSSIYVNEGDYVAEGAPLVYLDATANVAQMELQVVNTDQGINEIDLSISQLEEKKKETQELFDNGLIPENSLTEIDNNIENLKSKRNGLVNTRASLYQKINAISGLGVIYAKEAGIVTKMKIKLNQIPTMEDYIEIKKQERPVVKIYLTESLVKNIQVGEAVQVSVDDQIYQAWIKEIYSLNMGETLYPVDVEIASDENFISGMSVNVKIPIYRNDNAILLDRKAIINFNNEVYVFKIVNDKAVKTVLQVGETVNGLTEIKEGLQDGDSVVIEGQFGINDGDKVKVLE